MNNKIFSYMMATALALGFAACSPSEEDDIFDHSAAERLNMISGEYSARLTDSKGGWVMEYYPYSDNENLVTGVGYIIMNRFNSDGSVYTMMKNKASHNEKWEDTSAWEVITDMGPVLSYNTWNKCIGRFTDPVDIDLTPGEYSKDESGKGFQGDYEFVMVDVPENGNHIMLKGKKRGLYQRLTRVPEGTDFETYLNDLNSFNESHFNKTDLWELDMVNNGVKYKINRMYDGSPRVYPADKDSVAYGWLSPYLITKYDGKYHLRFKEAIEKNGEKMEQEFVLNDADEKFYGVENPENVISCTPAHTFFTDALNDTHRWQMTMALDKSDNIKAALSAMLSEMASGSVKYDLNGNGDKNKTLTFRKSDDELQFSFTVKFRRNNKNATSELIYAYKMEKSDGQITLTYLGARNSAAESFLSTFASVGTFLESLNGTYTAAGIQNSYSLRELKLTSTNDTNHWFDIQYAN